MAVGHLVFLINTNFNKRILTNIHVYEDSYQYQSSFREGTHRTKHSTEYFKGNNTKSYQKLKIMMTNQNKTTTTL